MSRILVTYYSRTGNTQRLAKAIATRLNADIQAIEEERSRQGWLAYLRSAMEVVRHKTPAIRPASRNAADYDLVVVGTPVWAGRMSSPVRSYLQQNAHSIKALAVFCTMAGSNPVAMLDGMGRFATKTPLATLAVRESHIVKDRYSSQVETFAQNIQAQLTPATASPQSTPTQARPVPQHSPA